LHLALRHVLGEGVRQAGSLVAPDRLRFDFTYGKPVTAEELGRIEDLVNRWILEAEATKITADRAFDEAVTGGAMALFGEKYGDRVRTVEVPGLVADDGVTLTSFELCGGCHVANTGEIGIFVITQERGVASGVRRIEAVTGEEARRQVLERRDLLDRVSSELGVSAERAPMEIAEWRRRTKELERDLAQARMKLVSGVESIGETEVDGIRVVVREVPPAPVNEIRNMADVLRGKLGSGVVVLGSRGEGKVVLVTAVSPDLEGKVHAGRLAKEIATLVGGSGGGRSDFAQAGGKDPEKLPEALARVPEMIRETGSQ
jgi:alanyl-tRNA synthetase